MDENMIPYIAFEACEMRHDKRERRLVAIIIVLIIALVAVIGISTYERLQYDTVTTEESKTVEIDSGEGTANYIGNDNNGEINNAENKSNNPKDN